MIYWDEVLLEPGLHIQDGLNGCLCGSDPVPGEPRIGVQCAHEFLRRSVDCLQCLILAGQRFAEHGWRPIEFGPYGLPCEFCGKYGDEETMELLSGDSQGCFECVGNWLDSLKEKGK